MEHQLEEYAVLVEYTQEFWDDRYRQHTRVWSGRPNRQLVDLVEGLAPGTALDVGCGEGADAIWLASRGWDVLGIDVSEVALSRAREHTAELPADVAARLDWRQVDLLAAPELPGGRDLVTTQFMHLPEPERSPLFTWLATLVGVGGTFLVGAHDPSDHHSGIRRPAQPELFYPPQEIAGLLDDDAWDIRVCETRPRSERNPEGEEFTVTDAVVSAVRIR
jgi:SAM-dependent methyltransferase